MVEKKGDFGIVVYIMGILSIVTAFFQPLQGIILGIIGLSLGNKDKSYFSARGKMFSKIGIILSIIILLVVLWIFKKYGGLPPF